MNTRDLTPGDRRELRSLVKKQFTVLRGDVKRREKELKGEVEGALLRKYRANDERVKQAQEEMRRAQADAMLVIKKVLDDLRADLPDMKIDAGHRYGEPWDFSATDPTRSQEHRALLAAIPQQIADAETQLDQDELDLLRELTIGALDSEQAQQFLGRIPTVGQLVPKARLVELEVTE